MVITAVVDSIEDGRAVLLSDGIEITVPADVLNGEYKEGETISLDIDGNGARVLITGTDSGPEHD